jgi:hypothetical protein
MENDPAPALKTNARVVLDRLLKNRKIKVPTEPEVISAIEKAIQMVELGDPEAAALIGDKVRKAVTAYLLHSYSRLVGDSLVLTGDHKSHIEWLYKRRPDIDWSHWNRYRQYMLDEDGLPDPVVAKVNTVTDQILGLLEDPARKGMWTVRGLVVGSVQSGKTANYCGLINKAVDAGYKLIVVVAGVHDNLRTQTQGRIDQGVVGKDTRSGATTGTMFGVGAYGSASVLHQLTTYDEDFSANALQGQNVSIGSDPVVLVVKKHSSILKNLRKWVMRVAESPKPAELRRPNRKEGDEKWIAGCPMLLVDDEADHASINTSKTERTAINNAMVELLTAFQQSSYVGYTATPYANLFADPDDAENIFPRNFIVNIPAPDNYVGVSKVFGNDDDPDSGIEGTIGLPIVRNLNVIDKDFEVIIPPKHKIDFVPETLPESLKLAIKAFTLTCAVRNVRRRSVPMSKHDSMLVHLSRFTEVMDRYHVLLQAEKDKLEAGIRTGSASILHGFKKVWEDDFVPTFAKMPLSDRGAEVGWDSVVDELAHVLRKVAVRNIHGKSGEFLDYDKQRENGLCVIAIGGDKLSRGLTLESLSVSYFLRTSKMYDTLMQMGRWFGYKDGYVDLCRIYTSGTLISWYKHIAIADRELRMEFVKMFAAGQTPIEYGLKVRSHPQGLRITALSKMRRGTKRMLTFASQLVQTTKFERAAVAENFRCLEGFIEGLAGWGRHPKHKNYLLRRDVGRASVRDFIASLSIPYGTNLFTKQAFLSFLDRQQIANSGYAEKWTIVCASNDPDKATSHVFALSGNRVAPLRRQIEDDNFQQPEFSPNKHNLLNPGDQAIDINLDEITPDVALTLKAKKGLDAYHDLIHEHVGKSRGELALAITIKKTKEGEEKPLRANGADCRLVRADNKALLIIYPFVPTISGKDQPVFKPVVGLAVSFAASDNVAAVEYFTNSVFERDMLGGADIDEGYYEDDEVPTGQLQD